MSLYKELAKIIRSITKVRGNDRECYITGSKEDIENNHLYRVADLRDIAYRNGYVTKSDLRSMYYPRADMSNPEHFKWHVLAEHSCGHIVITAEEIDRFRDLLNEMKPLCGEVPEDLLDEYIDLDKYQYDTIEKNLEKYQDETITAEMDLKSIFDNDIDNLSYKDILKTYYTDEQLQELGDDIE